MGMAAGMDMDTDTVGRTTAGTIHTVATAIIACTMVLDIVGITCAVTITATTAAAFTAPGCIAAGGKR
jgi:hypothetical protein